MQPNRTTIPETVNTPTAEQDSPPAHEEQQEQATERSPEQEQAAQTAPATTDPQRSRCRNCSPCRVLLGVLATLGGLDALLFLACAEIQSVVSSDNNTETLRAFCKENLTVTGIAAISMLGITILSTAATCIYSSRQERHHHAQFRRLLIAGADVIQHGNRTTAPTPPIEQQQNLMTNLLEDPSSPAA